MNIKGIIIKGFKDIEGHGDSRTFQANIYMDSKKVGVVMNNGWGGCHEYHFKTKEFEKDFFARSNTWGYETNNEFESSDALIEELVIDIENQKNKKKNNKAGFPISIWCKKGKETLSDGFTWYKKEWVVGLKHKKQIKPYVKEKSVEWYQEIL